jgi:hypothetical protein
MNRCGYLRLCWIVLLLLPVIRSFPQDDVQEEINETGQLEALAEKTDTDPEDDSQVLDLEAYRRHPLDLNLADAGALYALHRLTALQIADLLLYRKLLGKLLNIYELQAVPGWDLNTIRSLLPYIKVGKDESLGVALRERWRGGDASLLVRGGQVLERAAGYKKPADPNASHYLGSPQKLFFRYTYNYKQLLQYGVSGEKDAGEPFFRSAQHYGFDFYSFHLFLRQSGIIRQLALGDFTVNLGQGLTQWQSLAFGKGGDVLNIKRQADRLRPYRSAGEFNFHRGAGITLQKGKESATLFFSCQQISSNAATDTAGREDIFTALENSGYHRTAAEIADRNNNRQLSFGGSLSYEQPGLNLSVNFTHFDFSRSFRKKDAPYNLYSFRGRALSDASVDYSYTLRNMHLFGELAADQAHHLAFIQGMLLSLGRDIDFSMLYRNISAAYQSLYADAFTESSSPANEQGLYGGLSFRPGNGLKLEMYYDLFLFPWLRYGIDAPASGNDLFIRAVFQPDKIWFLHASYKRERKAGNQNVPGMAYHAVFSPAKTSWQLETGYRISPNIRFRTKMAYIWIQREWEETKIKQEGFLGFLDIFYHSFIINANIRIQRFLTPGYDFRIYIYENDMSYNFSLPAYYDNGWKYYVNVSRGFHLSKPRSGTHPLLLSVWLKWAQGIYTNKSFIGSGLDQIAGSRKSECSLQLQINW